jgi:ubiquinone/menaquinone biosynthesis C-methylase UbiE
VFVDSNADNVFGIKGYTASTYGDAFADVYDQWYASLDDADFMRAIVRDLPDSSVRILELGVGTGRLVQQLLALRAGINDNIVGVDTSEAMLNVAAQHQFPPGVSLRVADFSQSLPDGPFDVVFVGYNTLFNLPHEEAVRTCMQLVSERLSPTGHFYVDVVRPNGSDSGEHRRIRHMNEDEVVISVSQHHNQAQRITGQFIQYSRRGAVRIRPYSVRYFSPEQLDTMATDSQLRLVSRTEDGNGTLFTTDSSRHISKYAQSPKSPSILKAP